MNQTASHSYRDLGHLQDEHKLWLPAPKEWRLVINSCCGQINGLPAFRGIAVATNGIHVVLVDSGGIARIGHLAWFIPDQDANVKELLNLSASEIRTIKIPTMFEELFV